MIHFIYNFFLIQKSSKVKNQFYNRVYWHLYKFLKSALPKYYRDLPIQKLETNAVSEVVVSLTSFPERISVVCLSIKSVLYQTYKPLKVVLWLGKKQFPNAEQDLPESLLNLKKCGLEIEFCEDLKPHTKYYYAFQKYKDQLIVTVDDDWIYPNTMLETLMKHYTKNKHCVIANRVREIGVTDGEIDNYRSWNINKVGHSNPSYRLLATGVGGVLYKPSLFKEQLFDVKHIKELSLNADDIWLKCNEMLSDIPVVFTNRYFSPFIEVPDSQNKSLYASNVFEGRNDQQIRDTFKFFGLNGKSFE